MLDRSRSSEQLICTIFCGLFFTLIAFCGNAQEMFTLESGKVHFFSDAPIEKIEATNEKSKSLLNIASKKIAVVIPVIEFKFIDALMEEHFNENYLETHKYKTASFNGIINENIDFTKSGNYDVTVTGKLSIHGVEVERTIKGKVIVQGKTIIVDCKFPVKLVDHNIKIPKVVVESVAEIVDVDLHFTFKPKPTETK